MNMSMRGLQTTRNPVPHEILRTPPVRTVPCGDRCLQRFMTSVCNELWVVRGGTVEVRRPVAPAGAGSLDTPEEVQEAFADLMDVYREEVMASL